MHGNGGASWLQIHANAKPWFPELAVTNPLTSGFLSRSEIFCYIKFSQNGCNDLKFITYSEVNLILLF